MWRCEQVGPMGQNGFFNTALVDGHTFYFLSRDLIASPDNWIRSYLISELSDYVLGKERKSGVIVLPRNFLGAEGGISPDTVQLMGTTRSNSYTFNITPEIGRLCDLQLSDGTTLVCNVFLMIIQSYNFLVPRQELTSCPLVLLYTVANI